MNESINKPPIWFWIVAVLALVWNGFGVMAYIGHITMNAEDFALLSQAEQKMNLATPSWVIVAFAVGVFAGFLASVCLLLKKKHAHLLFVISLAAIVIQMSFIYFFSDAVDLMGMEVLIFPTVVIAIALLLLWFSRFARAKAWLR